MHLQPLPFLLADCASQLSLFILKAQNKFLYSILPLCPILAGIFHICFLFPLLAIGLVLVLSSLARINGRSFLIGPFPLVNCYVHHRLLRCSPHQGSPTSSGQPFLNLSLGFLHMRFSERSPHHPPSSASSPLCPSASRFYPEQMMCSPCTASSVVCS